MHTPGLIQPSIFGAPTMAALNRGAAVKPVEDVAKETIKELHQYSEQNRLAEWFGSGATKFAAGLGGGYIGSGVTKALIPKVLGRKPETVMAPEVEASGDTIFPLRNEPEVKGEKYAGMPDPFSSDYDLDKGQFYPEGYNSAMIKSMKEGSDVFDGILQTRDDMFTWIADKHKNRTPGIAVIDPRINREGLYDFLSMTDIEFGHLQNRYPDTRLVGHDDNGKLIYTDKAELHPSPSYLATSGGTELDLADVRRANHSLYRRSYSIYNWTAGFAEHGYRLNFHNHPN